MTRQRILSWQEVDGWTIGTEKFYPSIVAEAKDGDVLVEVGSHLGRSALLMAEAIEESCKDLNLICVDTWYDDDKLGKRRLDTFRENVDALGYDNIITPIVQASHRAAQLFADDSLFLVYIDGNHDRPMVNLDCRSWAPKVKVGGFLAGHDYGVDAHPGVKEAVDQFFNSPINTVPGIPYVWCRRRHSRDRLPDGFNPFWRPKLTAEDQTGTN